MSGELSSRCWLIDFPSSATMLVMMKLADCADDDGSNVFPSVAHIAREAQLSSRCVSAQIAVLRECGLIADKRDEHGNRMYRSSVVREINIDLFTAVQDTRVRGKGRRPSSHVIKQVDIDVVAGAESVMVPGALVPSVFVEPVKESGRRSVWAIVPRDEVHASADPTPAPGAGADNATPASDSEVPLNQVQTTPAPDSPHPCTTFQQPYQDSIQDSSPLTPQTGGKSEFSESGSEGADADSDVDDRQHAGFRRALLDRVRSTNRHATVVDHLIAPLVTSRKRLSVGRTIDEAAGVLADAAAQASGLSATALGSLLTRLIDQPSKITGPMLRERIATAKAMGAGITIKPGMPEWAAWMRHLEAERPQAARVARNVGAYMAPSQWPPSATAQGDARS